MASRLKSALPIRDLPLRGRRRRARASTSATRVGTKATLAMHADREGRGRLPAGSSRASSSFTRTPRTRSSGRCSSRASRGSGSPSTAACSRSRARPTSSRRCSRRTGSRGDDYALQLTGVLRARGARLPVPRERLRFPLALDGAPRACTISSSTATTKEKLVITDAKTLADRLAEQSRPLLPGARRATLGRRGARDVPRATRRRCPRACELKDYDYTQADARRLRRRPPSRRTGSARSACTARASSRPTTRSASPSSAPRSSSRGRSSTTASGHACTLRAGYHVHARGAPDATLQRRSTSSTEVEHFGNLVGNSPDLAKRHRDLVPGRLPLRGHGDPGEGAVPAGAQDAVAAHLRLRERRSIDGEADSEYAQIDDHGSLPREVHVRRERPEGRQGARRGSG